MSGGFAGRLSARCTLARPDSARNALGAASGGWRDYATMWGWIERVGDGAAVADGARAARPRWRVTLRPCAVAIGDRVTFARGALVVAQLIEDPALPDRVSVIGEDAA